MKATNKKTETSTIRLHVVAAAFQGVTLAGLNIAAHQPWKGSMLALAGICGGVYFFLRLSMRLWSVARKAASPNLGGSLHFPYHMPAPRRFSATGRRKASKILLQQHAWRSGAS